MINPNLKFISISTIDELCNKRTLNSLDNAIELISDNLRSLDNFMSSEVKKIPFETIIFEFVKKEHKIYTILNSKYSGIFKDTDKLEEYNKKYKIVEEYLADYYKECHSNFEKLINPAFRNFLYKFSDKFAKYKDIEPTIQEQKDFFELVLNDMVLDKTNTSSYINDMINNIDKYRNQN